MLPQHSVVLPPSNCRPSLLMLPRGLPLISGLVFGQHFKVKPSPEANYFANPSCEKAVSEAHCPCLLDNLRDHLQDKGFEESLTNSASLDFWKECVN
ncbi:unnamed protein product [Protopolystoma xenopodis]|uniref:Uncharacterized protein n=1 Tax=Protopolystoma xenopodis TaxID=117903 RepID=A0A448XIC8_9PLAT|nr:unnamed protein product [Protopolystoma xenopodis]